MNMNYIAMAAIALVSLTACGSNVVKPNTDHTVQAQTVETAPDWYMTAGKDTDKNYLYVVGTGLSRDMGLSTEKAMLAAQNEIAGKVSAQVDSLIKQYKRDTGADVLENTEQIVRKLVAEVDTSQSEVVDKRIVAIDGSYRTYVRIRYPVAVMLKQIEARAGNGQGDSIQTELDDRVAANKRARDAATSHYKFQPNSM